MTFGPTPLDEALGAVLAHSLHVGGVTLKKGRILTTDDVAALRTAGFACVATVRPESGEPGESPAPRIAAIVLAAGRSRRMGPRNKLLAEIGSMPMVRRVAITALSSQAEPVFVVTGHQRARIEAALAGLGIAFVDNPDFATGLSTSLRRGLAALPADIDGVVICLGDMPQVTTKTIDRLIAAFDPREGRAICVPTRNGRRGNPVLIARRFFAEIQTIAGDIGARALIGANPEAVHEVRTSDDGILIDIDDSKALADAAQSEPPANLA